MIYAYILRLNINTSFDDNYYIKYFNSFYLQFTFKMTLLDTAGGTSFEAIQRYAPI